ncbi:MAG: ABC transporter ATP-binding protein [Planctomycetota bacterium]
MSETAIRATGLHKSYGDKEAVRGLDFEVERGRIFGLIGPNGAGKSSTIRMLMGLSRPDRGSVEVFGEEAMRMHRPTRQRIGYLSEQSVEDHGLPLSGLLRYHSAFFPSWDWDRVDELVRRIDVPRDRPLDDMSAGQRRRCELVLTLAHDPDLLVLDDPTVGLDATVRRDFLWAALELARDDGKTIVFTSHVLHDVERIVDTVAILRDGRLAAYDELDALLARTKRVVLRGASSSEVATLDGELSREARGADLVVVTERFDDELERTLRGRHDAVVEHLNLEELFCEHAGAEVAR